MELTSGMNQSKGSKSLCQICLRHSDIIRLYDKNPSESFGPPACIHPASLPAVTVGLRVEESRGPPSRIIGVMTQPIVIVLELLRRCDCDGCW